MISTSVADLRYKEVINLFNGHRVGYVCDVQIIVPDGQVSALIVPGATRFFGVFGREEDTIIPWECITKIGTDIILVELEEPMRRTARQPGRMKKTRTFF